MIENWIDAELKNWAAACKAGSWPHPVPMDRAASAEGKYIRDSHIDKEQEQEESEKRPQRPDMFRAAIIDAIYPAMSRREQRIVVLKYVGAYNQARYRPLKNEAVANVLRISMRMYQTSYLSAAKQVGSAFRSANLV